MILISCRNPINALIHVDLMPLTQSDRDNELGIRAESS